MYEDKNEEVLEKEPLLFETPIALNKELEVQRFNTNTRDLDYLLIVNRRHYHINRSIYNLIKVIEKHDNIEEITREYSEIEKEKFSSEEVASAINRFLAKNEIVVTKKPQVTKRNTLYMFFKFTLLKARHLRPIVSILQYLYKPYVSIALVLCILATHIYVFMNFSFTKAVMSFLNLPQVFAFTLLYFIFSSFFHELGHVSASSFFGARYQGIGAGLYLRFPVLYSDVTDAWRLKGWQRAVVDVGGIYFQFILNILLFIIYSFTKQPILISLIQAVCIKIVFTLNPFFRFDGYWLAADLLGIPNLRQRAREILKYFIGKFITREEVKVPLTFNVNKKFKYIFYVYALVSNAYFVFFMILMLYFLPNMLTNLPLFYKQTFLSILNSYQSSNWIELLTLAFRALTRTFFMGITLYFLYKMIIYVYELVIKFFQLIKKVKS
jgi:putative peptide zinc metalloprotease protein